MCKGDIISSKIDIFKVLGSWYLPPNKWKQANVQPVHKKNSRQIVSNYRPISLLPICGKIFEKIMFDSIYGFFHSNNLLSKNQFGI